MGDGIHAINERLGRIEAELRATEAALAQLAVSEHPTADAVAAAALLNHLERIHSWHNMATTAATHIAVRTHVGHVIGSSKPADFLIDALGLSPFEAHRRLRHSDFDFAPLPDEEQTALRRTTKERQRELLPPTEAINTIHTALRELKNKPAAQQLYADALEQTQHRTGKDLKAWTIARVQASNDTMVDPSGGWEDRGIFMRHRHDGGKSYRIEAPPPIAALIDAYLAPAFRRGHGLEGNPQADNRTTQQRLFDQIIPLFSNPPGQQQGRGGVGLVVSMSMKDILHLPDLPDEVRFATNTDVTLSPMDILRLGVAAMGFAVVHDPDSGAAIYGGRIRRLASWQQRLMLFADKLVCSHPNCDQPASRCQAHHLTPFAAGGTTDPENLDLVCSPHHAENDDSRTHRNGKSFFDRDPATGRTGLRRADGAIKFNNTVKQKLSGGYKVRHQPWPNPEQSKDPPF